jgi:hypothetical protein
VAPRIPVALVVLVGAAVLVGLLGGEAAGVSVVGNLPSGLSADGAMPLLSDALLNALQAGRRMELRFQLANVAHGQAPAFDGIAVVDLQAGPGGAAVAAVRRCAGEVSAMSEIGDRLRCKATQAPNTTLMRPPCSLPLSRIPTTSATRIADSLRCSRASEFAAKDRRGT